MHNIWAILHCSGRYHPAYFKHEETINVGIYQVPTIKLVSTKHMTKGFKSRQRAIEVAKENSTNEEVCEEPFEWDGTTGIILLLKDWKAKGIKLTDMIRREHEEGNVRKEGEGMDK